MLRGGAGLYYNDELNTNVLWPMSPLTIAVMSIDNVPARADFAANPFNGPTADLRAGAGAVLQRRRRRRGQLAGVQHVGGVRLAGGAPCLQRALQEQAPLSRHLARDAQLAELDRHRAAVRLDVGARSRLRPDQQPQREVDPGQRERHVQSRDRHPVSASDVAHRAYPAFGLIGDIPHIGLSDYYGVQSSFTKRMANHWQASITYTLGKLYETDPPPLTGLNEYTGPVPIDIGGERSLAASDQRHRAVFNGI